MKSFNEFDPNEVDFESNDQDRVISQLIFDTEFLLKCKRKGLEPELFTSEIRRQLVDFTFEFFEKYKEAPSDQVIEVLSQGSNGFGNRMREEDVPAMMDFLEIVVNIKNSSGRVRRLYDRISSFIDKRIIHTTVSKLTKAKDRIDGSPDVLRDILQDSVEKLGISSTMDSTLGIFDETDFSQDPYLTRFNIPSIDNAYGGGLSSPNFVVLQGFTGRGKTWSICHLAKVGLRLGNDVVALVTEMNARKFLSRMRQTLTGLSLGEQRDNITQTREIIRRSLVRGSKFHLVSDQVKLDTDFHIDSLETIVEEIEERRGREQKIILIDSPDDMEPPADRRYNGEIEKSKAIYTWLRNYCQQKDKLIVVTSQSQRKSETLLWTTSGNIGDDLNKIRRSTLGISINGYKSEIEAGFIRLLVFKNTYGPDMKAAWVETDFQRGMFQKNSGEIAGLNMEQYKNMLLTRGISLTNNGKGIGS